MASQQDASTPVNAQCKRPFERTLGSPPSPDPKRRRASSLPAEDTHRDIDRTALWVKTSCSPEDCPQYDGETDSNTDCPAPERQNSPSNPHRNGSISGSYMTPGDEGPNEEKPNIWYGDARYSLLLQNYGSYMDISELGINCESKRLVRDLLSLEQPVPMGTLFDDEVFVNACRNLQGRNEARITRDISRLIVPSAEEFALDDRTFQPLVESVHEGWDNSFAVTNPRPQPCYSVGFKREAFTEEQLNKLSLYIRDVTDGGRSLFMATYYMYFPFLTYEVGTLDIADRQNAHSMTLAVRGITELFRAANRGNDIERQIVAFSISHDHRSVRIYGHYPVITGRHTAYYRHPIHAFDITALDGRDKWTAYRFTKNLYDIHMANFFPAICAAIDDLPLDSDCDLPPPSEANSLAGN